MIHLKIQFLWFLKMNWWIDTTNKIKEIHFYVEYNLMYLHNLKVRNLWVAYSKLSIIRPGRSRIWKKDSKGRFIEIFSKIPDCLIEHKNWPWQPWNKTLRSIFSWDGPRVNVQGVESLWGYCRFIPADWGS